MAEPLLASLREAVDLSDCGYPAPAGIGETFAEFAAARHGWTVDPGRVHLVPDVMAGFDAMLKLATEPGDGVVINPTVYPPFFKHIGFARRKVVEVPLVPGRPLGTRLRRAGGGVRRGRPRLPALQPAQPDRARVQPGQPGPDRGAAERYGVLVVADEIHASLTLPGARHTPFVSLGGAAAEHGITLASASKAFNGPASRARSRWRFGHHGAPARPAADRPLRGRAVRRAGLAGRVEFGRGLAGRAARAAGPRAGQVRPAAGRAAARGVVHPAGGELPGLGGLPGLDRVRNRPRCSWTGAGWRWAAGSTSARRATGTSGSPSAPAVRCCPLSWTGWPRRPRG